jgi:hypothetical protein
MSAMALRSPMSHDLKTIAATLWRPFGRPWGHQHGQGGTSHPSQRVHAEERSVSRSRRPEESPPQRARSCIFEQGSFSTPVAVG